jgi:hypothetical protein
MTAGRLKVWNETLGAWEYVPGGTAAGFAPANWCVVSVANPPSALTSASPFYAFADADLSILQQSGSDFSVGDFEGKGAILSAAGGFFQAGAYVQNEVAVTLGGSTEPRYLSMEGCVGDDTDPDNENLYTLGFDFSVPIFPGTGTLPARANFCGASVPGVVKPGGPALNFLELVFANAQSGDSLTITQLGRGHVAIWQVAA